MSRPLTTADALAMVAQKERRIQHPALLPVGAPVVAPVLSPREEAQREFDRLNVLSKQRALSDDETDELARAIQVIGGATLCAGCGAPMKQRKRPGKTGMCNRCWQSQLSTWTPEMDARLMDGTANKEPLAKIAAVVGRTKTACRKRRDRLAAMRYPFRNHRTVAVLDAQEANPCQS